MNIGLDVDDTITKNPEFFRLLASAIRKAGGNIHIISSRTDQPDVVEFTRDELDRLGVTYDSLYLLRGPAEAKEMCPHTDLDWYQRFIWQKADYCLKNDISVYFDDEEKVVEVFKKHAPKILVCRVC